MEFTVHVCDICFEKGLIEDDFWKKDLGMLHDCGEFGHFCDEHFFEAHNVVSNHFFSEESYAEDCVENIECDNNDMADRFQNVSFEQQNGRLTLNI